MEKWSAHGGEEYDVMKRIYLIVMCKIWSQCVAVFAIKEWIENNERCAGLEWEGQHCSLFKYSIHKFTNQIQITCRNYKSSIISINILLRHLLCTLVTIMNSRVKTREKKKKRLNHMDPSPKQSCLSCMCRIFIDSKTLHSHDLNSRGRNICLT